MISSVVCPAPMAVKLDQAAVEEYLRRPTMVEAIIKSNERLAPAELVKVENFTQSANLKTVFVQLLSLKTEHGISDNCNLVFNLIWYPIISWQAQLLTVHCHDIADVETE
ncbi:hypothetical protein TYRP_001513 [Tyrophagus putrescentiae]|nr:hypothetical protein TYRP_001513 [Tyrophagus putrescentiae]